VPPKLTAALAALAVEASPGEFAEVESFLGGSFSGLAEIRRNPAAKIDAVDLTSQEVRDWLSELPIGPHDELHVAWIADRLGARMSFETFTANVEDLWFPAMDDIVSVLSSGSNLMVLVLDHEELITLSTVNPGKETGRLCRLGLRGRGQDESRLLCSEHGEGCDVPDIHAQAGIWDLDPPRSVCNNLVRDDRVLEFQGLRD
jgi:hypothetical protein